MKKKTTPLIAILFVLLLCSCTEAYYFRRAMRCEAAGKFKKAIEYLDIVIEKDPKNYQAYINRGADRAELGDFAGAGADYSTAIGIDSTRLVGYMNRAENRKRMEDYPGALADCQQALRRSGYDTMPAKGVVVSLSGLHLPEFFTRYSSDAEQSESITYSLCDILSERGVAYYNVGRLSLAFKDLSYCIDRGHNLAYNLYWRGFVYLASGHNELGCMDLKQSYILGDPYAGEELKKHCNCGDGL